MTDESLTHRRPGGAAVGRTLFAFGAAIALCGCPGRAEQAAALWALEPEIRQQIRDAGRSQSGDTFRDFGETRRMPEYEPFAGVWIPAGRGERASATGQLEAGRIVIDGNVISAKGDAERSRWTLFATDVDEAGVLTALAWHEAATEDGRVEISPPLCVWMAIGGETLEMRVSRSTVDTVSRETARALPIRSKNGPACQIAEDALTLTFVRRRVDE